MPRSILSATITLGMLSIPVKLYGATESKDVSFTTLHAGCGTKIKQQRVCPTHDNMVLSGEETARAFEYGKGSFVEVSDAELDELPVPSKRVISLDTFVDVADVDRVYSEKSYFLEPEGAGGRPYALLHDALTARRVMGVGKVTLRSKERLCTIRTYGAGVLVLETLYWPDEVRDLPLFLPETPTTDQERQLATSIVDMFTAGFEPRRYTDEYRAALLGLIEAKRTGSEAPAAPAEPDRQPVADLMAMLKATLEAKRAERAA